MFRFLVPILLSMTVASAAVAQTATTSASGSYTYDGILAMGHAQYVARNFPGALEQYEKAKDSEPGRASAYYFIGCTMARQSLYKEATDILTTAATVAGEGDPSMHAKSLFMVAVVWEEAGDLDKAKAAWAAYKSYASTHLDANVFVTVADERVAAIEALEKRISEYQIVLDRIAAEPAPTQE